MEQKKEFGSSNAETLHVGDIVAWSKWSEEINDWIEYMGVLVPIQNEIRRNRFVSISTVVPLVPLEKVQALSRNRVTGSPYI